ncbi:phage tail-collar fiber domain-containing protein [Clostridium botulinum]|uniref:phage tail-collar fiber domain-containing protein n=1 Tax=Clostridium botulinum TaxID=1491 RepID=UPI0004D5E25A|nr:phage tail protein [Clostridium botulinum]KEH96189.1 phage tail fiber protein [Clostridium botulinum D str. 16868]
MSEQFYTILTSIGKAKIANASALGKKLNLIKFQLGDGGGSYYNPTEEQIELKNKVWEGNINSISVDENNPNWIVIQAIIPSDIGGFMIREAAILDDEENLIAIGKYPETYKPVASNGSTKDLTINMILEISNLSNITLKVDPSVIIATQKDIKSLEKKLGDIKIPVTSVNSKTGAIELKAKDIKAEDGTNLEKFKEDINSQYEEHTKNKKNPHAVTAKQIGAVIGSTKQNFKIVTGGDYYKLKKGDNGFEVKFDETFSTPPKVFTNMHTANPGNRNSSAMSATTSGFTLNVYSTTEAQAGSELYVSWMAIGGQ